MECICEVRRVLQGVAGCCRVLQGVVEVYQVDFECFDVFFNGSFALFRGDILLFKKRIRTQRIFPFCLIFYFCRRNDSGLTQHSSVFK